MRGSAFKSQKERRKDKKDSSKDDKIEGRQRIFDMQIIGSLEKKIKQGKQNQY